MQRSKGRFFFPHLIQNMEVFILWTENRRAHFSSHAAPGSSVCRESAKKKEKKKKWQAPTVLCLHNSRKLKAIVLLMWAAVTNCTYRHWPAFRCVSLRHNFVCHICSLKREKGGGWRGGTHPRCVINISSVNERWHSGQDGRREACQAQCRDEWRGGEGREVCVLGGWADLKAKAMRWRISEVGKILAQMEWK